DLHCRQLPLRVRSRACRVLGEQRRADGGVLAAASAVGRLPSRPRGRRSPLTFQLRSRRRRARVATEIPFAFSCLLSIAVGVVLLFTVEWRLALGLCALLPMVVVGPRWLGARAGNASYERQRDAADVMATLEESLTAHAVIKAFDLQGIMFADFGRRL